VLNSLGAAGTYGQSLLDMMFSPNYYYIWVDTTAGQSLVFDVPNSPQSALPGVDVARRPQPWATMR